MGAEKEQGGGRGEVRMGRQAKVLLLTVVGMLPLLLLLFKTAETKAYRRARRMQWPYVYGVVVC